MRLIASTKRRIPAPLKTSISFLLLSVLELSTLYFPGCGSTASAPTSTVRSARSINAAQVASGRRAPAIPRPPPTSAAAMAAAMARISRSSGLGHRAGRQGLAAIPTAELACCCLRRGCSSGVRNVSLSPLEHSLTVLVVEARQPVEDPGWTDRLHSGLAVRSRGYELRQATDR